MKKEAKICCPNCGRQYLPGEIFIPKYLVGQPNEVVRDTTGKIISHDGIDMNFYEEYECDGCRTSFLVTCDMKFFTKIDNKKNPNMPYITKLSTGLNLKET